jgi:hypothetical protein
LYLFANLAKLHGNFTNLDILIFVLESNSRVAYAFDLIFRQILKVSYHITSDKSEYLDYSGPKFVYRKTPLDKGLFFYSADLLYEKGIKHQNITVTLWNGLRVFYQNENYGHLPFDPFAAAFYLVTRYEEYIVKNRDGHGRFDHNFSLAKRNNFLYVPVVNYYAEKVKEKILEVFPDTHFPIRNYTFVPTLDIDHAYAYRYRGFYRTLSSLSSSFFKFRLGDFSRKIKVLKGKVQDPYDTYEKQMEIHDKFKLKPIYFFLLGDLSKFDRNHSHQSPELQKLITEIGERYETGMHPSYMSNRKPELFPIEKQRLETILQRPVTKSRQHFLKMKFPDTYRMLLANGIKEDYTMGYSKEIGFRASICTPFYFYDLQKEEMTELLVHSFCAMDSTMKYYLKIRSSEVNYTLKPLIEHVRNVQGEMITLFHNESFGTHKVWKNWGDVYEQLIRLAKVR